VRGALPPVPALLCVARPGHGQRVYAWLTLARPAVSVLTDGSGRSGRSRLPATGVTLVEGGHANAREGVGTRREAVTSTPLGSPDLRPGDMSTECWSSKGPPT
jgi:hypothetical protein